jgi:hypothetical protein
LQQARALEALEQIGNRDAVSLLETLSGGDRAARLTNEAIAALARLRSR